MVTITDDDKVWIGDAWYAHNNTWARGDLINGTDYTQSITLTESTFPMGVTMSWDWPNTNDKYVYAYPELTIGQKPWINLPTTFDSFPVQVSDLVNLDLNFDIDWTQDADSDFFVAVSLWLSNDPDGDIYSTENEIMIWLKPKAANPAGENTTVTGTDSLGTYQVWMKEDQVDTSGQQTHVWDFLSPTYNANLKSGTLDIDAMLNNLIANGLVSSGLWLTSVEIGAEIVTGSGSLTINDVSLDMEEVAGLGGVHTGDDTGNSLNGRHGDDTINGQGGDDTLLGMSGNDILNGGAGEDRLFGGSGNDTLDAGTDANYDNINPGSGDDLIRMSGLNGFWDTVMFAGGGSKTITGTGPGNDAGGILVGHQMNFADQRSGVTLDLSTGTGSNAELTIDFSTALVFNVIAGSGYADSFTGGNAAFDHWEQFTGYAGNDTFNGGDGIDAVSFLPETETGYWNVATTVNYIGDRGAVVDLGLGTGTDTYGDTDTFISIEALIGTNLGDNFTGGAEENFFIGNDGDDTLNGGDGDDNFLGGLGMDVIDGGAGTDMISFAREISRLGGTQGVTVNMATGTTIDTFGNTDTISNVETIIGTDFIDRFTGGAAAERFSGLLGNDRFAMGGGDDTAFGDAGNDSLNGGAGNDSLVGGSGIDTLNGGDGNDELSGNDGNDTLNGMAGNDLIYGGIGNDSASGNNGNDTLFGGDGDDTLKGINGADNIP